MKKLAFLILALSIVATTAIAQVPKPFTVYIGGGLTKPSTLSDFNDSWKTGFHAVGGIGFSFLPFMQTVGKVEFHQLGFDWDKQGLPDVNGNEYQLLLFGLEGRVGFGAPGAPFKPFIFGGGGLARISFTDVSDPDQALLIGDFSSIFKSKTKGYFNFGAGLEFKILPVATLYIQMQSLQIATDGKTSSMFPFTIGLKI